jgi:hypothetical protein
MNMYVGRYWFSVQYAGRWIFAVCRLYDPIGIRLYAVGPFRVAITWLVAPRGQMAAA